MITFAPVVRDLGIKLIYHLHDVPQGREWFRNVRGILERYAKRIRPDLVICASSFTSQFVDRIYPGADRSVWFCPVDLQPFDRSRRNGKRREMGIHDETVVILQVSRLEPWKGHLLHLQALGELKALSGWECWMVGAPQLRGESQYLKKLQALAKRLGIEDRVKFLGWRDDLQELFVAADVFCQPNTRPEPFGRVYVEALRSSLPVVATAFGGAQEIVTPECGVLANPGDAMALARALRRMVTDKPFRTKLVAHTSERAHALCDPETRVRDLHHMLAERLFSCL
jgi:glycosyltransferase involved in cell wall biosynthesis